MAAVGMVTYERELEIALAAVHQASIVTKKVMNSLQGEHFNKDDEANSEVTIGDFAAQALIIHAIHHHFPTDVIVAEESAALLRQDATACERVWNLVCSAHQKESSHSDVPSFPDPVMLPPIRSSEAMLDAVDLGCVTISPAYRGRCWYLDPIDGTKAFLSGQQYAVALCLAADSEQHVGVLGLPNMPWDHVRTGTLSKHEDVEQLRDPTGFGCVSFARKNGGSYIAQMTAQNLSDPIKISHGGLPARLQSSQFLDSRRSGSRNHDMHAQIYADLQVEYHPIDIWATQVKYVAMALGVGDAWFRVPRSEDDFQCVWDHAGGQLIYSEAGGSIEALRGLPFAFHGSRIFQDTWGYLITDQSLMSTLRGQVEHALATTDHCV